MEEPCHDDSSGTRHALAAAATGDRSAISPLLGRYRDWLRAFVAARMDDRLSARVDPSDVVQETMADVHTRLDDYLHRRPVCFRTWLMKTAFDRLAKLRRQHVTAACRSVVREIPLSDQSSLALVDRLIGVDETPTKRLRRHERAAQVRRALTQLPNNDREILLLRYVEGLDNQEVAFVLNLSSDAVRKRHGRALLRLHAQFTAEGLGQEDIL